MTLVAGPPLEVQVKLLTPSLDTLLTVGTPVYLQNDNTNHTELVKAYS